MKKYLLDVVIEKDKNGYFAYCPLIQGCYTQGETYEDALENIRDAIKLHLEEIEASKQKFSYPESISVTTLEVAARSHQNYREIRFRFGQTIRQPQNI